ncbi:uncharacterized protein LOC128988925 [Macrosteles quadrilineatus]|uniref:uncharacterized protein LOC128988925 n=1 Tax=Macrosteles quadrilineatus TaxID=74068 RepID=UPI0023E183A9|nr:uncharacterized protein LOC128988925 [Macrosteles quadrilineatus]
MDDQKTISGEPEKKKRKLIVTEKEEGSSVKFDGNHFRKLIKGDHPLGAVKQLLAVANNTGDQIINDYLIVGGSALEIILVIDKLESKIYYQYQPIFAVLSLIVTKCREDHPRFIPNTEEACKRLLRHNNQAIHANLGPNSSQAQKKITLSMLTAMVLLSCQLAREVLSTLSLRELTVNHLVKHPVKYDEDCTRGHFIRYTLAYFYHDNTLLIRQLLDNRNLLQSIILAGLTLDDGQLLMVFLTTLKEKIVDNPQITKTSKLKMFNTKIMMKFLETYTWTGPSTKGTNKEKNVELADDVIASLHQLLLQLCTNTKLGVAFVDPTLGLDQRNYNELVFSVIKSMDPYWNVVQVRELALNIVTACPDLVAPTFRHFGIQGFLQPEVTFSFLYTCKFAKQVVDGLSAERNLMLSSASVDQLTHLTVRTVFNMNLLSCVREGLQCTHPTLRLQAVKLLNAAFQTLDKFCTAVKTRYTTSPKTFLEYQQRINDHITKNVALEQQLMMAWSLGVGGEQGTLKTPTETEYYLPLVDLLLSYSQVFPVYLPPVFVTQLQTTTLDTINPLTKQLFDVKVIKFITTFRNVQPSQEEFGEMLKTLVPLLASQDEAKLVLKRLLMQSGYFEGVEAEVDLWVLNLSRFPAEDNLDLLLAVVDQAVNKPKHCMKMINQTTISTATSDTNEFNWTELIEMTKNPLKTLTPTQRMLPGTRLSILVPALVRVVNQKSETISGSSKFVTHLLSDILFSQIEIDTFSQLIQQCTSTMVEPINQYIANLSTNVINKSPFSKSTQEYLLLKNLTSSSFSEDDPLKVVGQIDGVIALMLVRLTVFYAARVGDGNLVDRCTRVLKALMCQLVNDSTLRASALEEVFLHPLVLQGFKPHQTSANLTPLVLSLVDHVGSSDHTMLKPYRQRFLDSTLKLLRKNKKDKSPHIAKTFSRLISGEEVVAILTAIVESNTELDQWLDLTESLLEAAVTLRCALPPEVITVMSRCDSLQEALASYLTVFTHLMDYLDMDHLTSKQEQLNKLCCLRLKFDLEGVLLKKLLKNNKKNPQVLFASLASSDSSSASMFLKHSSQMVRGMVDALSADDKPSWLTEHADVIGTYLSQLPDDTREEVVSALYNVPEWTEPHVVIARHLCVAAQTADFVAKTLQLLLSLTTNNFTSAKTVCGTLRTALEGFKSPEEVEWKPVVKSEEWMQWVRLSLKLGENPDEDNSFLLTTLAALCDVVYSKDHQGVKTITEMVLSHSQFLTVMLGKPTPTKTALLELLLSLLRLDSSVMVSTHVPVLLAAYSASLSTTDQLILQLLQLYESLGIVLTEWKPFLWGETAASFYSVRSTIAPGLWNKQNFSQLMDLFEEHKVNTTIANFPVQRALRPSDKMEDQPDVYDPAFYLPMLVAMFAPSEVFYTYKTCQSGCLSLVLAALSSHHEDVRRVAYVALQRFHCHLISNTNNQDSLWLHFLDAVRRGLSDSGGGVPRITSVVAVFLCRCVLALTAPTHPLYLPLAQYLLAKPRLDLHTAPELLPLFNSFSVQYHSIHQDWILSVLRDGMKDEEDFNISLNSMAFKITLDYFSSTLASDTAKTQILEVLGAAVKLKNGRNLLVDGYGLYPWLSSVVKEPGLPTVLLSPLISVLANLIHKSSAAQVAPLLVHVARHNTLTESQLACVLAALTPHPLSADTVAQLVDIVDNTVGQVFQHRIMLEHGVKYVEKSCNFSDVRGYLKEIIRLHKCES